MTSGHSLSIICNVLQIICIDIHLPRTPCQLGTGPSWSMVIPNVRMFAWQPYLQPSQHTHCILCAQIMFQSTCFSVLRHVSAANRTICQPEMIDLWRRRAQGRTELPSLINTWKYSLLQLSNLFLQAFFAVTACWVSHWNHILCSCWTECLLQHYFVRPIAKSTETIRSHWNDKASWLLTRHQDSYVVTFISFT